MKTTSKTLFLVRHAKAEKEIAGGTDFERPLAKRGLNDAADMAARLKAKGIVADYMVTSPANRAKTTALIFADILAYLIHNVYYEEGIYEAWADTLLSIIRVFPNEKHCIFLFGHNPGFENLAQLLSDTEIESLPTCGIAQLNFTALEKWSDIRKHTGKLTLDYPKNPEY